MTARIASLTLAALGGLLALLDPRLAAAAEAVTGEVAPPAGQRAGDRDVRRLRRRDARSSPSGRPSAPIRRPTSTPRAAASPASRTAWRSPATTCRRRRSWAFPRLVFASGYDGLIYSIGFLVGWPIILFLIAERLRNLGKFTFADVASFRLRADPDAHLRCLRHAGRGGLLPDRADGRRRQADPAAVRPGLLDRGGPGRRPDDAVRAVRRHDRHHLGADHQGRACCCPVPPSWPSW